MDDYCAKMIGSDEPEEYLCSFP